MKKPAARKRKAKPKKPKAPETTVFSKRIKNTVLEKLEEKGIDAGAEVQKHLEYLSGLQFCPTCNKPLKDH